MNILRRLIVLSLLVIALSAAIIGCTYNEYYYTGTAQPITEE